MGILCCGFNGVLGLLQVLQGYHGLPLYLLPKLALVPPAVGITAAYCGYQFCKEVTAIAAGYDGVGPQDSCFVKIMGGDWWPASLGPSTRFRSGGMDSNADE